MPAESEQDAGQSIDEGRIHRESGVDHLDRSAGDRQDASRDGTGYSGVSDGQEGAVLQGERSDYAIVGGERRETSDNRTSCLPQPQTSFKSLNISSIPKRTP